MRRLLILLAILLLPQMVHALDAETRALERAALCQAMPYREECGGKPRHSPAPRPAPAPPQERTQMGLPLDPSTGKPVYTPPVSPPPPSAGTPTREDFIRAAELLCLGEMPRLRQWQLGVTDEALYVACVRAYLAREGITLP